MLGHRMHEIVGYLLHIVYFTGIYSFSGCCETQGPAFLHRVPIKILLSYLSENLAVSSKNLVRRVLNKFAEKCYKCFPPHPNAISAEFYRQCDKHVLA